MTKITPSKIKGVVLSIIFATILFAILPTLYTDIIQNFYNFTDDLAGMTTQLGTGPAGFAGDVSTYAGWFWVIGPFIMVIGLALGLLAFKKGRR